MDEITITKNLFFEKINKIDSHLTKLRRKIRSILLFSPVRQIEFHNVVGDWDKFRLGCGFGNILILPVCPAVWE